jgi:hypothetical protein
MRRGAYGGQPAKLLEAAPSGGFPKPAVMERFFEGMG